MTTQFTYPPYADDEDLHIDKKEQYPSSLYRLNPEHSFSPYAKIKADRLAHIENSLKFAEEAIAYTKQQLKAVLPPNTFKPKGWWEVTSEGSHNEVISSSKVSEIQEKLVTSEREDVLGSSSVGDVDEKLEELWGKPPVDTSVTYTPYEASKVEKSDVSEMEQSARRKLEEAYND